MSNEIDDPQLKAFIAERQQELIDEARAEFVAGKVPELTLEDFDSFDHKKKLFVAKLVLGRVNLKAIANAPAEHILQFFSYGHLPPLLATISKPFCELAHAIVYGDNDARGGFVTSGPPVPANPERTVALRKLLEAKDAAVRAVLAK